MGDQGSSLKKTRTSYAKQVWFERIWAIIFLWQRMLSFRYSVCHVKMVLENFDRYQTAMSVLDSGRMRDDVHAR
jgi:hypothetical protein